MPLRNLDPDSDNSISQVGESVKWQNEGNLVILDKEKADSIVAAVGKQYSEGQDAIDFSQNSIPQNDENVKGIKYGKSTALCFGGG